MGIINKTWHPRTISLLTGIEEGRVKPELDSLNFDTLCDYYLCTIEHQLDSLRKKIEHEFEVRGKSLWIIPTELFTQLNASMFGRVLATKVWQTTAATLGNLVIDCFDYFPPAYGFMIAYVEALAFGKDVLAAQIKKSLQGISTVNAVMPKFLELVYCTKGVTERLAELAKYVQNNIPLDEALEVSEDIEKHEELNPKLFNGKELKPEIKEKAIEIAEELIKDLEESGVQFKLKDLVLTGSNASYNYTKDSDIDIHLIADMTEIADPDNIYPTLFNAYRSLFNKKYDINFYDIPVEVYIESSDTPTVSNGIYSILKNIWLKEPKKETVPDIDLAAFTDALKPWEDYYKKIIKISDTADCVDETPIDSFINELYKIRASGLAEGGEFSLQNLIFKELRNKGYLTTLKDLRDKIIARRLSVDEVQENFDVYNFFED